MRVLFVGQSLPPSKPVDHEPFRNTMSGKRLNRWLELLLSRRDEYCFVNACEKPGATKANSADLRTLIMTVHYMRPDKIVALGKTAAEALSRTGQLYFQLPHPSGRNRVLNDATRVRVIIKTCRDWLLKENKDATQEG